MYHYYTTLRREKMLSNYEAILYYQIVEMWLDFKGVMCEKKDALELVKYGIS